LMRINDAGGEIFKKVMKSNEKRSFRRELGLWTFDLNISVGAQKFPRQRFALTPLGLRTMRLVYARDRDLSRADMEYRNITNLQHIIKRNWACSSCVSSPTAKPIRKSRVRRRELVGFGQPPLSEMLNDSTLMLTREQIAICQA
jgi:hypothetical protein